MIYDNKKLNSHNFNKQVQEGERKQICIYGVAQAEKKMNLKITHMTKIFLSDDLRQERKNEDV